jgi:hypothetical protein
VVGQIVEPLLFGESTGVTPLALIVSALFWGMLWGPIGLLLSTPITICLLVLATHAPHLGFLQVMLGDEPALSPHQQIYRRLIRKAVADASTVALAEIEAKGPEQGLDDGMGRMVALAATDHARDRLTADQVEAIVNGTDEVLEFLAGDVPAAGAAEPGDTTAASDQTDGKVRCIGGRGQIDDAAASIIAFALRRDGLDAESRRRGQPSSVSDGEATELDLICYASHPSSAVRRYTARKFALAGHSGRVLHLVVDFEAPAATTTPSVVEDASGSLGTCAGSIATLSRWVAQHARLDSEERPAA